jgi:hypothetical protein
VSLRRLHLLVLLAACDGGSASPAVDAGAGPPDAPLPTGTPELPPQGQRALEAWLAAGHYQAWACEQGISNKRFNGAHARHRVCSNRLLLESLDGPYPVGAASVKEMFQGTNDRPNGFAVGIKVAPGLGEATWYWYERTGTSPTSSPVADGVGAKLCGPDCHTKDAPRDQVFIRARE